jgi:hypothetical protein
MLQSLTQTLNVRRTQHSRQINPTPITKPEAQPNYTERSVVKPATLKNYFYLSTAPCYRHDLIFNALTTKTH